jgi:hypothetical protein
MSKESTLITAGVLIMLSPFLGLPSSWFSYILPVLGIVILAVGYTALRARRAPHAVRVAAAAHEQEPSMSAEPPAPSPIA